ncbi:MATE family efflux transporter [Allorhodopirellula solitaria]|uniref:Multidrug-efflux transporter n=1 Tax=Allorhodopirellula solitaria TaxID=2527987 RepID=A0A5C5XY46_9BACT|nr:MATE family efflux transporter [Allorhodopirellula solitaria]TWT67441.1 Multidrug resistance protein NorM [Allorhodopirellula solitaria]
MRSAYAEVLRVAVPLMISTGMFSLVLFVDRTLLFQHEPSQMGAAMAAGNLFWVSICVFVGIASMTGAIASQYVGAGQPRRIGRLLWQSVWFSLATMPVFLLAAYFAEPLFRWTDQAPSLIPAETIYFQILMWGGAGEVMQTALSGFFSGTHRTRTIAVVSVVSGVINLLLDYLLIFGVDPAWWGAAGPRMWELGIAGAALASVIAFWFKAVCYAAILLRPQYRFTYGILQGMRLDRRMLQRLIYFGFPAGLMYATEATAFTVIVLMIGRLGDVPLQATTMAINFNMIAFIPLVGLSIAASVLVGRHLVGSGPDRAVRCVWAALTIAWLYSAAWALIYWFGAETMISLYSVNPAASTIPADARLALQTAQGLLGFVAIYVLLDATQLILAGALRGAGDTWFVMIAGLAVSIVTLGIGLAWEPDWQPALWGADATAPASEEGSMSASVTAVLMWWWWIITAFVVLLAAAMTLRYAQGSWKNMRMI